MWSQDCIPSAIKCLDHSTVEYNLIYPNKSKEEESILKQFFDISDEGVIFTKEPLDASIMETGFVMTVTIEDKGFPALKGADATVLISVLDKNQHAPVFDKQLYIVRELNEVKVSP